MLGQDAEGAEGAEEAAHDEAELSYKAFCRALWREASRRHPSLPPTASGQAEALGRVLRSHLLPCARRLGIVAPAAADVRARADVRALLDESRHCLSAIATHYLPPPTAHSPITSRSPGGGGACGGGGRAAGGGYQGGWATFGDGATHLALHFGLLPEVVDKAALRSILDALVPPPPPPKGSSKGSAPPPPPPPPRPPPQTIRVPPGWRAGQRLTLTLSDGRRVDVSVPPTVGAGGTFSWSVPPSPLPSSPPLSPAAPQSPGGCRSCSGSSSSSNAVSGAGRAGRSGRATVGGLLLLQLLLCACAQAELPGAAACRAAHLGVTARLAALVRKLNDSELLLTRVGAAMGAPLASLLASNRKAARERLEERRTASTSPEERRRWASRHAPATARRLWPEGAERSRGRRRRSFGAGAGRALVLWDVRVEFEYCV